MFTLFTNLKGQVDEIATSDIGIKNECIHLCFFVCNAEIAVDDLNINQFQSFCNNKEATGCEAGILGHLHSDGNRLFIRADLRAANGEVNGIGARRKSGGAQHTKTQCEGKNQT